MTRHGASVRPVVIMWAAIVGSVTLLAILLFLGWHDDAWTIAAAVLLLSCVFICIWAAAQGRTSEREVQKAVARLVEARKANEQRRNTPRIRGRLDG